MNEALHAAIARDAETFIMALGLFTLTLLCVSFALSAVVGVAKWILAKYITVQALRRKDK